MRVRVVWLGAAVAAMALWILAAPASAAQHYGPFTSGSPDSSTCGNNWANDRFDRHFFVRGSGSTLAVVEEFKNGTFTTVAGHSPGGCDTNPGGMVADGITGSFHGYFIIPLAGETQISTDPTCVVGAPTADCTSAGFINTHFAPACYPDLCPVTTFLFHYSAGGQGLVMDEWKNASADRGGNQGDIASS